ncbi:MAG TPA: tRNA lysidine(34) synthetase TilS [Flavisolibacter sp.]
MNEPSKNILQKFEVFLESKKIRSSSQPFLLAVSGGMDSVVLCELFKQSLLPFSIAHCNFQLRGEESSRDEDFVRSLGIKYGVEVYVNQFDTEAFAAAQKISIQEAARKLRYNWFLQLKKEQGFGYIVTAHHADDNIETLLMNFFRGTGLQGLTGIPEMTNDLLRPLLFARRGEIKEFASEHQLQWVEDSSNLSSKYTRNFLRLELIPAIKNIYPEVENNLLDNISRFKKINEFYRKAIIEAREEICEKKGNEWRIPIRKILKYDYEILLFEIMKEFGFGEKQLKDIISLMQAGSGKFISNDAYQVIKHGHWLVIAPKSEQSEWIPVEKGEEQVVFGNGRLEFRYPDKESFQLQKSDCIAQLDARHIEFPLTLRKWKQGDYFYPLGMKKKKKLARFFIDRKLSKNQKENAWVLESNKKIIWVVGMRIDERFRITDNTRNILLITYQHQAL